jgi:uncharacterized protein (DUF2147 family)
MLRKGFRAAAAAFLVLVLAPLAAADSPPPAAPLGRWLTESKRGVIEIYRCGSELCGRLVWMIEPMRGGAPAVDDNNPDPAMRQRRLCGLAMLGGFHADGPDYWEKGWIYDPDSGKTYDATITVKSATMLELRGYIGAPVFGQTQTWTRPDAHYGAC